MPASRSYWKGYLKLSFVSCPIALFPAISAAERISFQQISRRTGHRLKHRLIDSVTGQTVDAADKARGYEVGENDFLVVEDRDLERARRVRAGPGEEGLAPQPHWISPPTVPADLGDMTDEGASDYDDEDEEQEETVPLPRPQNTRTIQIERFLPAGQIDARYFEKPYYIVPREEISQESFAVIRDAMGREDVVGLARVVLSSRERPVLLEPAGRGLLGVTLRFAQDIRNEADYFSEIPEMKLPSEMMKLAQHIIRTRSACYAGGSLPQSARAHPAQQAGETPSAAAIE
ncbi:Ku protein [Bradyrhizobium shewense]|uniref:Ku protein n=1 Tax=Bradyrhizobium shewense TaxID=1761772 RepID=A0A1C3XPH4_9BRAD|nr:Ku protein [Bradyrhizobium shewense]SCB54140.1 Ku protein [Bradyrhizobium shewense]